MKSKSSKHEKLILDLTHGQANVKESAYKIGYAGKRHPAFSAVGEDAEQQDIDRAISVHIIDRDNEASGAMIEAATIMLRPVLESYIQGLKDGCAEKGNPHLWDMGRRFREQVKMGKNDAEIE